MLHADNAAEYRRLANTLRNVHGTSAYFSNAYTPQENGIAERRMRALLENVREILFDGHHPAFLWAEAPQTVTQLINWSPSAALGCVSPYRKLTGRRHQLDHLRGFGCGAF
ncbi:TPA: hypothetical protein N0F65_011187 [Lagenidium giganteum]|uniref:Integrase catalytic domain-containing protein n=1 Tax=Lagenidium giganteum TaxID=4803 RepID=A0AAV2ZBZ6_9STRA|nr:TPA: hypothetical protein N0F65_011187 [Lagenidium giganteum]